MDKGSYKFKTLCSKYDDFRGPAFLIKVGGVKLDSTEYPVDTLEVDLCADGSAGGCRFTIGGMYDFEKSEWLKKLTKTIQVGAKLEIQGGYVKKESIFYGYVDECEMEYSVEAIRLSVTGVDGFGFLMSCREPYYGGKKKPKQVVEELLKKAVSAGFAKSVKVGTLAASEVPPVKERLDDFRYLKFLAERYCMNLLCVDGELIFDDVVGTTKPIISLAVGTSLLEFRKRTSLKNQVGEVVVWGRDVNQKFIKGSAKTVKSGGSGKSAAQVVTKLKTAVQREYCEYVRTAQECEKLAQARLDSLAMDFVSGEGVCLGIPEIIPGRYIEIDSQDKDTKGSYFITKVHHRFDQNGYRTIFEFKGAKS